MNDESIKLEYGLTDAELLALAFEDFACVDMHYQNIDYSDHTTDAEPTYRCCGEWYYCFCSPWERLLADYTMAQLEDMFHHIDIEPEFGPLAPISPLSGVCVECGGHWVTCPCEPF